MPAEDPVNQDVVVRLSVQPQGDLGKHFQQMAGHSATAHRQVQQDMDRTSRVTGQFAGRMGTHFSHMGHALRGVHMGMLGVTDVALRMSQQFGAVNFAAQDTIRTMAGLAEAVGTVHMLFMGLHGLTGLMGTSAVTARANAEAQRELAAAHGAAAAAANAHAGAEARAAAASGGAAAAARGGALGGLAAGGMGAGALAFGAGGAALLLGGGMLAGGLFAPRPFYARDRMGDIDVSYLDTDASFWARATQNPAQYLLSHSGTRSYLKGVSWLADHNPDQMVLDYLGTGRAGGRLSAINRFEEGQQALTRAQRNTEARFERERILAIRQAAERTNRIGGEDVILSSEMFRGGLRFDLANQQAIEAARGGALAAGTGRATAELGRLSSLANAPGGLAMRHQLEQQYQQFELEKAGRVATAQTGVDRARAEYRSRKLLEDMARTRYRDLTSVVGSAGGMGLENAGEQIKGASEELQHRAEQTADALRKLQQAMVEQSKVTVENAQKERELAHSRRLALQSTLDNMGEQRNRLAENVGSMDPGRLQAAVMATRHLAALRQNPNLARDVMPMMIRQGNRMVMRPGTSGGLTDVERQLIRESGGDAMLANYDRTRGLANPALAELDRLHGMFGGAAQRGQIQGEIDRLRNREDEAGKLITQGQRHLEQDLKAIVGPAIEKQTNAILAAMRLAMEASVQISTRRVQSEIEQAKQQLKNGNNGIR